MDQKEFIGALSEMVEMPPDELSPATELADLALWDSSAVISFMAFCDERYGRLIRADRIPLCRTVGDLMELAENSEPAAAE